ncbi:MAG: ABC transporter ATP-binding protein [Prevotella sp.]|nr:ABC transporter ATP-binding protein [Prevotella sp.]
MRLPNKTYPTKTIVKWLWQSSSDNRLQAILNTVIGLLQVVVSLASVWAVQRAIDIASHDRGGSVITAVVVMACLVICGFALNIASVWVRNILGIKAQNRMQRRMLGRILHSEWQGRDSMHSGDVLNRLEQDVNNVVTFVAETLPNAVSVVALFLGAFVYLFTMDHMLAMIIVVMFPLFLVLSKIYMGRMRKLTREVRESDSIVQSILQESVQNRILVKTLESEDEIVDRLGDQHSILRQKVVRKTRFSILSNLIVNVGFASGYLVAFGWSALRLSAGSLSYGGMTAFLQLVNKIQNPARNLSRLVPQFVSVFTAAERLMLFEDIPLERKGEPQELKSPCGVLVHDVTFAYADEPDKKIVDHLTFDFKPGTCTAIVGETGAGKTTLLRMILALIRPDSGFVYMYDAHERIVASPLTRCNITYVPQGNTMLSGTIRDNLLLGNVDATDEEMYAALDEACADFVRELPDGLDTEMSEQGVGLSEGQAQRVCIARALLRNSPLMILDEATSALDPETEKKLLNNILEERSHTVIFITHRPVVLNYCDASLNMERLRSAQFTVHS